MFKLVTDPTTINPALPPTISQMILKMTEKDWKLRYENWSEVIDRVKTSVIAPTPILNINAAVTLATNKRRKQQSDYLESLGKAEDEQEQKEIVEFRCTEIHDGAKQLVDAFNEHSEMVKLRLMSNPPFEFSISCPDLGGAKIEVTLRPHIFLFGEDGHFKEMTPIAWGVVRLSQTTEGGFNLVLLRRDEEDEYGAWYALQGSDNPSQLLSPRPAPFAFDLDEEGIRSAMSSFIHSDHKFIGKWLGQFNPELFVSLVKRLVE